jgi:NADH dehydrogenase [ubiquinone] 1 alpha subcomplex assembly factor 1
VVGEATPITSVRLSDSSPTRPRVSVWRRSQAAGLLPSLLLVLGLDQAPAPAPHTHATPVTLFTFDEATEADWEVVNDGVMGGRSAGFVAVADGTLRFTGTLVTDGGGFTSVRARRAFDLTGQEGIELRVRGSGRPFELEIDDGRTGYGRSISRRAAFPTTAEWTLVRVPFSALRSTIFGRAVNAPPIDLARISRVGLYMADGRDGPFRLEVDFIRSYGAGAE